MLGDQSQAGRLSGKQALALAAASEAGYAGAEMVSESDTAKLAPLSQRAPGGGGGLCSVPRQGHWYACHLGPVQIWPG